MEFQAIHTYWIRISCITQYLLNKIAKTIDNNLLVRATKCEEPTDILVINLDLISLGNEDELRNGLKVPIQVNLGSAASCMFHGSAFFY